MPEHQKVQKRSQKKQSIQDKKKKKKQKEITAAEEEMQRNREEIDRNEERFRLLSDKVDKNKMADANMEAERDRRLERREEARMLRKQVIVAWRRCGNSLSPWEQIESRLCSKGTEKWELPRGRCQEEKKEEGTVKTNKSREKLVSSWCHQRQAASMKALHRAVWSFIFVVHGVHMGKTEEQGVQVQQRTEKDLGQIARGVDVRWKKMPHWVTCEWKWDERAFCEEEIETNSQGKDPRT